MLSAITITFNNHSELLGTIDSLAGVNVQHVIVNGGNDPETINLLKSSSAVSISEKDHGISDAFNKGLSLASGDAVVFINSGDILIDKKYYDEAMDYLSSNQEVDFIYADICFIDQYSGEIRVRSNNPFPHMPFLHPTLIVRKSAIEKVGKFDLNLKIAMDLDFAYRLVKLGYKGHYIPRMVVKMDGQGVSSKHNWRNFKEIIKVISKNHDWSLRSINFLLRNFTLLLLKKLILKLGGSSILGWYRKKRYS
jgi:GT2 family glycosyltransferase